MAVLLLLSCAGDHDAIDDVPQMVTAQLNFSLPSRIAGKGHGQTRMSSDVAQVSEVEGQDPEFRGIDDVHMLCFDKYPDSLSSKKGGIIEVKTAGDEVVDTMTTDDYSLCQEIQIPVGTSHFAFYARAADAPKTHEDRMKYGVIETVGLSRATYQDNRSIRFRPVPICTSKDNLGGSATGQALLNLLNDLMVLTVNDEAPNDRWATANNMFLNEAYQRLTSLKTLSSSHVQTMLGAVLRIVNQEAPDDQGSKLVQAINDVIIESCQPDTIFDIENGIIVLKSAYQGFPDDIHLPVGAARIEWNETQNRFVVPTVHDYGKSLNELSINDYAYPMNLQYQVFSDILASDEQVLFSEDEKPAGDDASQFNTWQDLLDEGYVNADKKVKSSTQSVAMVKQVQYAVGRLALRARIGTDAIYDADNNYVSTYDDVFTLKGYIIGGQREVNYDFQPVAGSRRYAIYDTALNGGLQGLKRHYFTDPDYVLGLGTAHDENICLAMELVNNGAAFQGADGLIVHGATFYLVADMKPQEGQNYTSGSLDQIFSKDRATQVNLTIKSLATATYGMPSLDVPHPTVAVSVNLSWGEGLWFEEEL